MIDIFSNEVLSWKRTKGFYWPWVLVASGSVRVSSLAEKSTVGVGGGMEVSGKQAKFYNNGMVRVTFDWKGTSYSGFKLYIESTLILNHFADGETYSLNTWYSESIDVPVRFWQTISLNLKPGDTGETAYVRNFRISYDKVKIKNNLSV